MWLRMSSKSTGVRHTKCHLEVIHIVCLQLNCCISFALNFFHSFLFRHIISLTIDKSVSYSFNFSFPFNSNNNNHQDKTQNMIFCCQNSLILATKSNLMIWSFRARMSLVEYEIWLKLKVSNAGHTNWK